MANPADLEELVRGYVPDGDSWSHELAITVVGNERPMWPRSEFEPGHFTASGFVTSPDGEALLLIHHGKLDRWLQPGGHIDPEDASVDAAARREIFEETGVGDLERVGASLVRIDVHEIPERGSEPEHLHLDLGLGFRAASWSIGPIDEVVDAKWVAFDDLESYGVDEALLAGAWSIRSAVN